MTKSEDIFGCHNLGGGVSGDYWYLLGRGQGNCLNILQYIGQFPQ